MTLQRQAALFRSRIGRRWASEEAKARSRNRRDPGAFAATVDDVPSGSDMGDLFVRHDGRLVQKWAHYLPAYDEQFARFRTGFPLPAGGRRPVRMLELGVDHGGSLQMWRRYFGPAAGIWGIDINPACTSIADPDLEIRIGSQADPSFLRGVVDEMGGVDIVLDDGSHLAAHQRASFETLFPLLPASGLYVVEDTHTAYWRDYGGGRRRGFLGLTADLIDDVHGWYHGGKPNLSIDAVHWVPKVTVYDSMVAIEKQERERPMYVSLGTKSF